MNFQVTHSTIYEYEQPVSICYNCGWLLPRPIPGTQEVGPAEVIIQPSPSDQYEYSDLFGNRVVYFSIHQPHTKLVVTAQSALTLHPPVFPSSNPALQLPWEEVASMMRRPDNRLHLQDYLEGKQYVLPSPMIPIAEQMGEYARKVFTPGRPIYEALYALMEMIFKEFKYDPEYTTIATPVQDVLKAKRGVCQDFAHLAISCLRSICLPARYVSGYIETLPPPGKEKMIGADASHAWFSAYIPGAGWFDFDPTNNQVPHLQHITVAWGRSYVDVPPLKGINFGSGGQQLKVEVTVARQGQVFSS